MKTRYARSREAAVLLASVLAPPTASPADDDVPSTIDASPADEDHPPTMDASPAPQEDGADASAERHTGAERQEPAQTASEESRVGEGRVQDPGAGVGIASARNEQDGEDDRTTSGRFRQALATGFEDQDVEAFADMLDDAAAGWMDLRGDEAMIVRADEASLDPATSPADMMRFIRDCARAWYGEQIARGRTADEIVSYLHRLDQETRDESTAAWPADRSVAADAPVTETGPAATDPTGQRRSRIADV